METPSNGKRYRTIFVSDIHLGARACQAGFFLDFLRHHEADTFYLVGVVVDFWRIKRGTYWPLEHDDVVQKLLRKGSRVVYIPGNHDEALRAYCGAQFGGIKLVRSDVHISNTAGPIPPGSSSRISLRPAAARGPKRKDPAEPGRIEYFVSSVGDAWGTRWSTLIWGMRWWVQARPRKFFASRKRKDPARPGRELGFDKRRMTLGGTLGPP